MLGEKDLLWQKSLSEVQLDVQVVEGSVKDDIDSLLDQVRLHVVTPLLHTVSCSSVDGSILACPVCAYSAAHACCMIATPRTC